MSNFRSSAIKRAQKESLLQHELSMLLLTLSLDDSRLQGLSVSRIKLSHDKSICTVFLYTSQGQMEFDEKLKVLVMYKPSVRKAIADTVPSRYVPQLVFKFDDQFEKQQRIDELLDKVKEN